jgi:hypothetical protein
MFASAKIESNPVLDKREDGCSYISHKIMAEKIMKDNRFMEIVMKADRQEYSLRHCIT